MSKRRKIIITSFLLSLGLLIVQWQVTSYRYWAILLLGLLTYLLSAWSLKEGLDGVEWVTVLTLPPLFTVGMGLFYFLLPDAWLARVAIVLLYALGIYILLLTENIYSVATIRNIQLLRAAQASGFLLTLVAAFFLFDTVFSFRLSPWLNSGIIFVLGVLLFFQGLWPATLEKRISAKLFSTSLVLGLVLAQVTLGISFWPLTVSTSSLFLITVLYILLGLMQNQLQDRLFPKTVREYLWLGVIVFLTIFLTTGWGG